MNGKLTISIYISLFKYRSYFPIRRAPKSIFEYIEERENTKKTGIVNRYRVHCFREGAQGIVPISSCPRLMYVKKQTMKLGGNLILIREAPSATSQGKGKTAWKVEALYSVSASWIGSIDITSAVVLFDPLRRIFFSLTKKSFSSIKQCLSSFDWTRGWSSSLWFEK